MRDGELVTETRTAGTIFEKDSLQTLLHAPVTVGHPHEMVGVEDWREVVVGVVTRVYEDGDYVGAELMIHDSQTIEKLESRELVEISAGYFAQLSPHATVDFEQTGIKYNHVALLPPGQGRAGSEVRVMDRKDGKERMTTNEHTVNEVDLAGLLARIDALETRLDKGKKDMEMEEEEKPVKDKRARGSKGDEMEEEDEEAKDSSEEDEEEEEEGKKKFPFAKDKKDGYKKKDALDEAMVADAVSKRVKLMLDAQKAGIQARVDASESEVYGAIIKKLDPKARVDEGDKRGYAKALLALVERGTAAHEQTRADSHEHEGMDAYEAMVKRRSQVC
jgi:hypothetical protein